ncbi:MAG: hypothetical protein LC792_11865 [Actinobacteria bacterium]|nr:hypothetical protein [Actinomycetota bacterium]
MFKRLLFAVLSLMTAVAGAVVSASAAGAVTTNCTGQLSGVTVDAVNVPSGARCTMLNSVVNGDVTVQAGSAFLASSTRIVGQLSAYQATVQLTRTTVGGSVNHVQPVDFPVSESSFLVKAVLCGSTVNGDYSVQGAPSFGRIFLGGSSCGSAGGNTVRGSLVDSNNQSSSNEVAANSIGGYLVCQGNSPAPTGGGNTAPVKVGQCAAL